MQSWQTIQIRGQASFPLETRMVKLAVTRTGAMLGPVTFFPQEALPIAPYHVAPWAEESLPADVPNMLRVLRGDWFCSAFGGNSQAHEGRQLPPHGESANLDWRMLARGETGKGRWLRLGIELPLQGGKCEATTALLEDHSVVYQRHDLSGLTGPINPGHHATLQFNGAGRLSFSRLKLARTYIEPIDGPESAAYSRLKPDTELHDLGAVPCRDGTTTDLRQYPARRGFDDIVILCADPTLDLAWSAVTFPSQGYVWFALRNPRQLASTLLWFSNGGRHFAPWNGRHVNVMGIEDITAFFHVGLAASCKPNSLSERGVRTCLDPDARGGLSIPYIQGVARIPAGFDRVATIEPAPRGDGLLLRAESGVVVETRCQVDFLHTGILPGLEQEGGS